MNILEVISTYLVESGFGQFQWPNLVMIVIGLAFIYLAIRKGFEPLLLVPIGFGILIGNIPFNSAKLPLSVYDGPVAIEHLHFYEVKPKTVKRSWLEDPIPFEQYLEEWKAKALEEAQAKLAESLLRNRSFLDSLEPPTENGEQAAEDVQPMTLDEKRERAEAEAKQRITADDMLFTHTAMRQMFDHSIAVELEYARPIYDPVVGEEMVYAGKAIMVNEHSLLSTSKASLPRSLNTPPVVYSGGQGRQMFIDHYNTEGKYPQVWSIKRQQPSNASVFWYLFAGVGIAGFYPPLIFLGIGALTDFGPMLANPKTLLLGAAAQFGIFGALLGAVWLFGFSMEEAASIGIIGGADGPTAIFTCSQLAPHLLGAVALAAYSYMAMVPIIQPPIIKLLTTKKERLIRMKQYDQVSRPTKIMFPIVAFLLTAFLAPGGLPLLGMLFFGNLLRESLVTDRLAKTAQTTFIDIVTILLGVTVGAKTSADYFLTTQTIFIFLLGIGAFAIATSTGLIFAKIMNLLSKDEINPMIGAAGVSAVPMAARVVHKMGQDEDPQNFLLMHAMGPNVAGVIGSAVAAGVLLSWLAG